MGLFDTIKENTNLVRGESSQSAGKFDQQIEAVEGQIREARSEPCIWKSTGRTVSRNTGSL